MTGAVHAPVRQSDTKRLLADEAGMQIVMMALIMPAVLGLAALPTGGARFGYNHLILQAAATAAIVAKLSEGGLGNV